MMRKIYLAVLLLFISFTSAVADEGDTTTIITHNGTHLSWYDNYDTTVSFPDGTLSYRKITMEFVLGKYMCEGYDPYDAGEISDGHTGWCGDWDYDVHVIACTAAGDTLELGELITPYANSTFPAFPWEWTHSYLFDVTDFYPVLKDDVTIRIFYAGYSGGFTGTVKFHFIEGTPPRDVVGISKLWHGGYAYGNASDPIEDHVAARAEHMPETAESAEMKLIISGHGGDAIENCAEFCSKWYRFTVDDEMVTERDIWRDNCGDNPLSPQSGTWIHNRANWCPGSLVNTIIEKVPATVAAGSDFTADLDFQPYTTSGSNPASYKLSGIMFYYGPFNRNVDAGIESIISPNDVVDYGKINPICGSPEIMVKNYGSETISSITFEYGIEGEAPATYTWTAALGSLQEAKVTLPVLASLNSVSGSDNLFKVRILEVNGGEDEDAFNNEMQSRFTGAPVWQDGIFRINFKMSGSVDGAVNTTNWQIVDVTTGSVIASRNGTVSEETYNDTVRLANGCYKLEVDNIEGYGLSFFGAFASGFIRVYDLVTGSRLPIPDNDLGASGLAGNFGKGFTHYFRVENSTGLDNLTTSAYSLNIFPNPANDKITLEVIGTLKSAAAIQLVNVVGQVVYETTTNKQVVSIFTASLPAGIYSLIYNSGDQRKIEKIVIAH